MVRENTRKNINKPTNPLSTHFYSERRTTRGLQVVNNFDPWGSPLCTCPLKYSLNPYTGCSHSCLYCYATAYIGLKPSTPKKNYLLRLTKDIPRINPQLHIDLSTSTDPYPPEETKYNLTRKTLELLTPLGFKILIITKSNIVKRDIDIISTSNIAVTMTITTLDKELASKLEPKAPPPSARIRTLEKLSAAEIPVGVRFDPVFPFLTDDDKTIREVLEAIAVAGAKFVVTSIYKARPDNLSRLLARFEELRNPYTKIYRKNGQWLHGYWYAPASLRRSILTKVKEIADKLGLEFATCRENFHQLNTAVSCDGSHLIPIRIKPKLARLDSFLRKRTE